MGKWVSKRPCRQEIKPAGLPCGRLKRVGLIGIRDVNSLQDVMFGTLYDIMFGHVNEDFSFLSLHCRSMAGNLCFSYLSHNVENTVRLEKNKSAHPVLPDVARHLLSKVRRQRPEGFVFLKINYIC